MISLSVTFVCAQLQLHLSGDIDKPFDSRLSSQLLSSFHLHYSIGPYYRDQHQLLV